MKVLFLSANLGGNVPPTMAVARELCRRGVEVEVAGLLVDTDSATPEGQGEIADVTSPTEVAASWGQRRDAAGAPAPLGPTLARIFLSRGLASEAEALIRDRRPDVVVVDCMALALVKGAGRSGLPVVVLLHTFAEYWRRSFLRGPVAAIVGALGFSPRALWGATRLRLLLTDPLLDPARQDPEFAGYVWTGTTEVGAPESTSGARPDVPRVIVSFSTTPLPGMRRAYRNAIEALRDLPVEAIVTTGGFDLGDPAPSAPNAQIVGYVPHAEVLPGSALLIGHGGHSTTMEGTRPRSAAAGDAAQPHRRPGPHRRCGRRSRARQADLGAQRSRDDPAGGCGAFADGCGPAACARHGCAAAVHRTRRGGRRGLYSRGRTRPTLSGWPPPLHSPSPDEQKAGA